MLQIHDIRESRVYQDALQEGREEGLKKGQELGREEGREEGRDLGLKEERRNTIIKLASRKMTAEQIAAMLDG